MSLLPARPAIAVLGGTGKEGKGLSYRWAQAGYHVIIGSRERDRAEVAAAELMSMLNDNAVVSGAGNWEASQKGDVVVLAVPYAAHRETLSAVAGALSGKILIDATVPLVAGQVARARMPAAGSAAQEAKEILGTAAEVTAAFHSIPHEYLMQPGPVDSDVLVTGTSKAARAEVLKLVAAAGLRGWDAGALENSMVTEGLVSVLISINKNYGSTHAGIRITGVQLG